MHTVLLTEEKSQREHKFIIYVDHSEVFNYLLQCRFPSDNIDLNTYISVFDCKIPSI